MTENQLSQGKKLLNLKGYSSEEEPPEPKVDVDLILQEYKDRAEQLEMQNAMLDQLEIDILKLLKMKMEKAP